jgi:hypothetical protein
MHVPAIVLVRVDASPSRTLASRGPGASSSSTRLEADAMNAAISAHITTRRRRDKLAELLEVGRDR